MVMRNFISVLFIISALTATAQSIDTVSISPDLQLVKLTGNTMQYIATTNLPNYGRVAANGLVLVGNKKALLVNTPWNNDQTKLLYAYLAKQGIEVEHAVVTHWHADCLGGLGYLQQKFILSTSGERTYETSRQKNLPLAFIRFKDTLTFNFQGIPVECFYPGPGHTADNIVVNLPSEKILFGGCLIKDAAAKGLGNLADADVKSWPASLANTKKHFPNAAIVVPGHGKSGNTTLIDHTLQLLGN